jgi:hypothetical protein
MSPTRLVPMAEHMAVQAKSLLEWFNSLPNLTRELWLAAAVYALLLACSSS